MALKETRLRPAVVAAAAVASLALAGTTPARADDAAVAATFKDIEQTRGGAPSFVKSFSKAALPGLWQETKALTFSDNTALPRKVKALISLAVAAQIPCSYCIWSDTRDARSAGASDEEIREAVAVAGLTRQISTIFNGMQIDFETFKKELGGDAAAPQAQK
jgi:AhpD family alkylhydroperoxidase